MAKNTFILVGDNELEKGEKSGFEKNFRRDTFLSNLHEKHTAN